MSVRLRAAGILLVSIVATRAEAIPAFARKYGMSCSACHVAYPVLNQQGIIFRDNGYQFGLEKDEPTALSGAYVPLAARTVPAYQFTHATNQPGEWGKATTRTGGLATPTLDLMAAGTFGKDVAFLAVLAGFSPDEAGSIESAWGRVSNVAGTGWLNVRFGKFELDLPMSERRDILRTSGHAVYAARFPTSAVAFSLTSNQTGVELEGHDARSLTRYSLALVNPNGDPGGRGAWSSPLAYAHVSRAFELDSDVLPWLKLGAHGAMGWWPTRFATAGGAVQPGTGHDYRRYSRVGAELQGIFGSASTPFMWTAVATRGQEEASAPDVDPAAATEKNTFTGGYLEVLWVPFADVAYNATPWALFARYDTVRYEHGPGDFDGVAVGVRRQLALGPRAALAVHVEGRADRTKGIGFEPAGSEVQTRSALVGFDIAF
jgi:hypothetical protein